MTIMMLATWYCILIYVNAKIGGTMAKMYDKKSHGKQPAIMNSRVIGIQLKQGPRLVMFTGFFHSDSPGCV